MRLLVLPCIFISLMVQAQSAPKLTAADAEKFMTQAEARLGELSVKVNQAEWVQENFITDDTEALSAGAQEEFTAVTTELIDQAKV